LPASACQGTEIVAVRHVVAPVAVPLALAAFAATLWCAPALGAGVTFAPPTSYVAGTQPVSLAVADFDRDGQPDIAAADNGTGAVSLLLGRPGGSLGAAMGHPVGGRMLSVAAGDFDRDGYVDLVVRTYPPRTASSRTVSVLPGGPGGSLGAPTTYPVGDGVAESVGVGDFNGDGDLDLAVPNSLSNTVSVLLGGPGASFGGQTTYPVGDTNGDPRWVVVGDFNRDGDPDLAVTNYSSGTVSVLLGGPGGSFGSQTLYPAGDRPLDIAAGDFNHDNDLDLAITLSESDAVAVLAGGPGGSFGPQATYLAGGHPHSVAVGDFNRDGDPDLAVTKYFEDTVSVLLGGSAATFSAPTDFHVDKPWSVEVGDFNRDGDPDLAVANSFSPGTVSVLLNNRGLALAPVFVEAPDTVIGEESAAQLVTLTNHGQTSVSVSGVALAGPDVDGFATGQDGCSGVTLAAGGSCTVGVRFHPGRAGAYAARLEFTDDAPGSPQPVALMGTGISPVALSPASIAFAPRPDHTQTARRVTLTNVAGASLTITGITVVGTDASSFPSSGDTCTGRTMTTGQSCTVVVSFRPLGTGAKTAALRFSDSAVDSPQTVALSGTGTPGAWLEQSALALKYGHVRVGTSTPAKTVTLTNVGSAPMTISNIAKEGTNPTDFRNLTETCTALGMMNPGQSCSASIAFRPTATGTRTATLTIADTAPRNPHRIALSGTGT